MALLGLAIPVPGEGQWTAAARSVEFESRDVLERSYEAGAPTADLVVGAALGGLLGMVPGAILGAPLVCATAKLMDPDVTRCGLGDSLLGAGLGSGIGMAVGAHLVNDRRGSWPIAALAATAIGGSLLWGAAAHDMPSAVLPFIPAMMLITAVAVEQRTGSEPEG